MSKTGALRVFPGLASYCTASGSCFCFYRQHVNKRYIVEAQRFNVFRCLFDQIFSNVGQNAHSFIFSSNGKTKTNTPINDNSNQILLCVFNFALKCPIYVNLLYCKIINLIYTLYDS